MALSRDYEGDIARLEADLRRYQEATEAALDSLDWAIGYLERHRQTGLVRELHRNRTAILRALGEDRRRRW